MKKPTATETFRKKHYGRCRICGRVGKFTKEHVPPQSALNSGAFVVTKPETKKGQNRIAKVSTESSGGMVYFTLCERCNNKTGRQFGADYVELIRLIETHACPSNVNQDVLLEFRDLHPLRIIKQVISMFLSTSKPTSFIDYDFVSSPGKSKKDLEGISIEFPAKDEQRRMYEDLGNYRLDTPTSV